ncbi:MAG: amidohydrolase family protein [Novosphingobium sp.]|nr:amidohydrolase family protein [Novosphingobium sp.]
MTLYDGPIFDSDMHVVEDDFAFFEEYLPKQYHEKWLPSRKHGPDGEYAMYVGDRKLLNYDFRDGLVPPPGSLKEWLRAMKEGRQVDDGWIPATPDMIEPAARLAKLDEFGVEAALTYVGNFNISLAYYDTDESGMAVIHAYNRWLHEHWGFAYGNRIYTAGCLALWDTQKAIEEVEWLIERGVRIIAVVMGPAQGKSLAHPDFDPVWSRLNEAGIVVAFHLQEASFMHPLLKEWGEKPLQPRMRGQTAWQYMFAFGDLPIQMTLANIVYHNFFERFPNIRMVSVENGAAWLPGFLDKMDKARGLAKNGYWPCGQLKTRPSRIFMEHVKVVAYPEDPLAEIVERIGSSQCLLMGSDYPHPEGVARPRIFAEEALDGLGESDIRAIMYENGRSLIPA